jgi:sugar phosphate isomerase/epimerase
LELACSLHVSHGNLAIPKAARLVAEAGFSGLEISPWIQMNLTRAAVDSLRMSLRRNDLTFSGFTAIYPPEMKLASSSATARKQNVLYTKRLIELTHTLAGRSIVWGSGAARNIPKGVPLKKGYRWLIELLKTSASLADERGVKIAIEPINRFESTIIHSASEALSLARSVEHDSIGIVYDTFHTSLEESSFTGPILQVGKRLAAVHISDCNRKIPGKGHIDFQPIFNALKEVGYDGYVTLEAILPRNPSQDLVACRRYLETMID